MRRRISIRGCVRPSVVRPSLRPSVPSYFQTRTRRILCRVSGLVFLLSIYISSFLSIHISSFLSIHISSFLLFLLSFSSSVYLFVSLLLFLPFLLSFISSLFSLSLSLSFSPLFFPLFFLSLCVSTGLRLLYILLCMPIGKSLSFSDESSVDTYPFRRSALGVKLVSSTP